VQKPNIGIKTLGALVVGLAWTIFSTNPVQAREAGNSLDRYLIEEMTSRHITGMGVGVIRSGKVEKLSAFGTSSVEFKVKASVDTLFSVASVSKSFTSVALMTLVEAGKLKLDDSIDQQFADLPAAWQGVTIRQLLNHTSGIPDILVNENTTNTIAETSTDAIRLLRDNPLLFAAGSQSQYNQTGYMLLGMLIEKISGMTFAQYVAKTQFEPLGLRHALFADSRLVVEDRATVYTPFRFTGPRPLVLDHAEVLSYDMPPMAYPAAGLNISVADFATWLRALIDGKIISRASLDQLWAPAKLNDGSIPERPTSRTLWKSYGLGWVVDSNGPHPLAGGTGGVRAAFFVYPRDDLAVIVLTNTQGTSPESLVDGIAQRYFRNR
jgi:CubicO group peptidase (beta-lactamase class C family)